MAQAVTLRVSARGKRYMQMPVMARNFLQAARATELAAADKATQVSRATFNSKLSPRPVIAPRLGRPTTGGQFANEIVWERTGRGDIKVDYAKLPRYSLIQEIGTGQAAHISNPPGSVRVRSQVGRYISANLVWDGPGGPQSPSVGRRGQDQLVFRAHVNDEKLENVRARRIRIRREIKGKHYLRDGGKQGFRTLKSGLFRDAKRIFQ